MLLAYYAHIVYQSWVLTDALSLSKQHIPKLSKGHLYGFWIPHCFSLRECYTKRENYTNPEQHITLVVRNVYHL